MECEFCNKHFSTKGNLLAHQRNAKYCVKVQEENKPKEYICRGCGKKLSNNHRLQHHQTICEKYGETDKIRQLESIIEQNKALMALKDEALKKLENRVELLEEKLVQVAMKTTIKTTNNITNITNNFTPITDEDLAEDAKKLTLRHLLGGGPMIAGIFTEGCLKNNAICTDISRRVIRLKDQTGKLNRDAGAINTTKRVFSSIFEPAKEIRNNFRENMDLTNDDQIENLGRVMTVVGEISQTIDGKPTEVGSDFAKAICVAVSSG